MATKRAAEDALRAKTAQKAALAAQAAIESGDLDALRAALPSLDRAALTAPAQTPLLHPALRWEAAHLGDSATTPMLDLLLEHGADPNVVSFAEGETPALMVAGRQVALERLLRAGADPEALVVAPPGWRHVQTVRALVSPADRALIDRLVPLPSFEQGFAGGWGLIAESTEEGSDIQDATTGEGSFELVDGLFSLLHPLDRVTIKGAWPAEIPVAGRQPIDELALRQAAFNGKWSDDITTRGRLQLDDTAVEISLCPSILGPIGDRLRLVFADEATGEHGAVRCYFARRGAFHRTPLTTTAGG